MLTRPRVARMTRASRARLPPPSLEQLIGGMLPTSVPATQLNGSAVTLVETEELVPVWSGSTKRSPEARCGHERVQLCGPWC